MEKKRTIWHFVICVGLVCLIWGGYFFTKHYVTDRILDIKQNDFSWVCQVDEVGTEGENLVLFGFAFELNIDAVEGAFEIVLQDVDSKNRIFLKTEYLERNDVNDFFYCEYDYLKSGFKASCKREKISREKAYEILVRKSGKQATYSTGTYVVNNQLMDVNPMEYEPLEVVGTDLQKVIENGKPRVYRPNDGIYIYQYEGDLYWIAEPEYAFYEDGDVYVQYRLNTNQTSRLPVERLENRLYWDDYGFMFCRNEILDWDTGKYRVAMKKLPTEYAVTKICSGKYDGEWVWMQEFRPYYQFEKK